MDYTELIESLSPIERKILPFLDKESFLGIIKKSGLDRVSVLRALEFLSFKKLIDLKIENKKIIDLGTNGVYYKKKGLPERQLLHYIEKGPIKLNETQKISRLSNNEFKAALGALKKKGLIEIKNGTIIFSGTKEEVSKKSLEEQFLYSLPLEFDSLKPDQLYVLKSLQERKDIIVIREEQIVSFSLTKIGKEVIKEDITKLGDLIEELTSAMILKENWKNRKFRRYDVESNVPKIYGGKKHFVNQSVEYARRVWIEMGFKEMSGNLIQESFWNFDALFTAQDHPVRDLQDTFFLGIFGDIPDKKIIGAVKKAHESGVPGSKGWGGNWSEDEAKKLVLRTHTTCLSARTLYELSKLPKEERKGKYFAVGKCFRNETIDWKHGFEFNQTEGIVIDKNANFQHLLGYLKKFFEKMGFSKVRFRPHYFPYTEPSVEIDTWHEERNEWIELGGAGIFRPEVTIPLLGEWIPVLAWGPGFDRILMDYYSIKDLRELYGNDIKHLREMKIWIK
ncbi:MAG: phenylalanine--tRNA ligase subunit alpha [Candidatus Pacearchaeota archaeon]